MTQFPSHVPVGRILRDDIIWYVEKILQNRSPFTAFALGGIRVKDLDLEHGLLSVFGGKRLFREMNFIVEKIDFDLVIEEGEDGEKGR